METGKKSRAPSGRVWAKPCSVQELKIVTRLLAPSPAFAPPFDPLGIPMDGGMRRSLRGWGSEWDALSLCVTLLLPAPVVPVVTVGSCH